MEQPGPRDSGLAHMAKKTSEIGCNISWGFEWASPGALFLRRLSHLYVVCPANSTLEGTKLQVWFCKC